jgi:hypothetical protein
MAIAPNTTFVAGNVYTAAQANAYGFGIVALGTSTTASGAVAVETLSVTSNSFTAIANRYYKISYFEPALLFNAGTVLYIDLNIRITSIAGAIQQAASIKISSADRSSGISTVVKTLSAGATVMVGTFTPTGGGTATAYHSASTPAYIVVEDIGPA